MILGTCVSAQAVTVRTLDFSSTSDIASTSTPQFSDGASDYFTLTDGTNISPGVTFTNPMGTFFAAQDIDAEGAAPLQTITFDAINIAGFSDLVFSGLFAEDAATDGNADWDPITGADLTTGDFFTLEYDIDGGGFANLLSFRSNAATGTFNGEAAQDTNFDGVGDGTVLGDTFSEFVATISGTGNSLTLRANVQLNSGDEDIAFDNFTIAGVTAVPEPGSLFALGTLGVIAQINHRRRRRAAKKS